MTDQEETILQSLHKEAEKDARRCSEKANKVMQASQQQSKPVENSNTSVHSSSASKKPTNIFQQMSQPTLSSNIFATKDSSSIDLFKVTANNLPPVNIFNRVLNSEPSIPKETSGGEEDESATEKLGKENDDNDEEYRERTFISQPKEKVMKFQYNNQLIKIMDFEVRKFRNGTSASKEDIMISLEKLPENPAVLYLIARNRSTHVIFYQSLIMRMVSKIMEFMGKEENVKMNVVKIVRNTDSSKNKKPLESDTVKIQFVEAEACKEFKSIVEEFLKGKQVVENEVDKPEQTVKA